MLDGVKQAQASIGNLLEGDSRERGKIYPHGVRSFLFLVLDCDLHRLLADGGLGGEKLLAVSCQPKRPSP